MKSLLSYADLLLIEDLVRDYLAELRFRAEEHGRENADLIDAAEATLGRLREAIETFPDEDL